MLPSTAEMNSISITNGSPAGSIRVSKRSNRFERDLLVIHSVPPFSTSRFDLGAAPGPRTPQDLGPGRTSIVCKADGVRCSLLIRQPARFAATPPAFAEYFSPTRPANFVTGDSILKQAKASGYRSHGVKNTVIPSEWSSAGPQLGRSSNTHHSTFGVLVGSRVTIATWRSPVKSAGRA